MRALSWDSQEAKPRSHKPSNQLNIQDQTYPIQAQLYTESGPFFHGEQTGPTSRQWQSIPPMSGQT